MKNNVYDTLIDAVKEKAPDFHRILMMELSPHENHHYYHAKILSVFRHSLESGFLSEQFRYAINELESEFKKFIFSELVGTWVGTADDKVQFTLQFNSVSDFTVYRSWTEQIDGELFNENQEFKSLDSKIIESDDLVIFNLFACEKRITKIKLALYPAIAYHKHLIGSMFWYQDNICNSCSKVILEKA